MAAKLISIIGPPAVGKTTLAEHLAEELPAGMIREDYQGNPFLADSYTGPHEARLPAQIWYLLSRVSQLAAARWPGEGLFVSDYGFCQDRIYAVERLSPGELGVYDPLHERLAALVHPPDVLVVLDAATPTLLERIALRGRDFEKAMTADFLAAMRRAYNSAKASAPCPVLPVDCDEVDIRTAAARRELIGRIRGLLLP